MNELIQKIEQWAEDRNIIKGTKPIDQAMKLFSEAGELADNVGKGRDVKDDIGDCIVVVSIISEQLGSSLKTLSFNKHQWAEDDSKSLVIELMIALSDFSKWASLGYHHFGLVKRILNILNGIARNHKTTLDECVQVAYNDIKNRKGIVFNGTFIKESDPAYKEALTALNKPH